MELEKKYLELEKTFISDIPVSQISAVDKIKKLINAVDIGENSKGFSSWNEEKLILAREKLARNSEFLGEWISYHECRSDFAYIWRKGKLASEWQPMKTKLSETIKERITNTDIESALVEKYMDEQYYSMMHRRRADYLILLMETVDKIIRSIDSRLKKLWRQYRLPQSNSYGEKENEK